MDKDKIINEILSEWAMRSPDGLAGGYSTSENVKVFSDLLSEYGLPEFEIDEVMNSMFGEGKRPANAGEDYEYLFKVVDPKNPKNVLRLISIGHPDQEKYPDYPESSEYKGPHDLDPEDYKVANDANINKALAASETDPIYAPLRNIKKVSLANVRKLKEILSKFEKQNLVIRFRELYNGVETIDDALKIYKGELYPELQPLINKIDENRFAGAGRGEIPIVFMLKGASSGGNKKMDIIFAELGDKDTGVEVKEISGGTIAISAPTLTNFSNSKFNVAIHELALAANKTPEMKGFLKKVLEDDGTLYKKMGPFEKINKYIEAIDAFFVDPKVGEVSQFLLDAIFIISEKIKNPVSGKAKELGSIEIDIGNKHREFKVPDDQVASLNSKIDNVSGKNDVLNVPVEPKKEKDDAAIADRCMKLSFFRENWDQKRVQKEIMDLILGKYSKMIIIDKRKKQNNAYLYNKNKIATLEFIALGFGKLFMYVPGMGTAKDQASTSDK